MNMKRLSSLVAALLLVPVLAAADDFFVQLSGAGGAQGFASLRTGSGTVSYGLVTNGVGTLTGAQIRQGANTFVDLGAGSSSGSAGGSAATGANLAAITANPGGFTLQVNGSSGSVSGPLELAAQSGPEPGPDPVPGTIALTESEVFTTEFDGNATLTVTRTGGSSGAVGVQYATTAGTATAGDDFTAINGTITFADGDSAPKTIIVPIVDDSVEEGDETLTVTLSSPTGGATLGTPAAAEITIGESDAPCFEDATTLCLEEDRFEVRTEWRTNAGATGVGTAVELTDDTGYFWFFNPANVEMVVKVLNACADPFNRFWVFAGGLTNVEVQLIVRDTEADVVNTYTNPIDTPFQPIQDTDAFATCP